MFGRHVLLDLSSYLGNGVGLMMKNEILSNGDRLDSVLVVMKVLFPSIRHEEEDNAALVSRARKEQRDQTKKSKTHLSTASNVSSRTWLMILSSVTGAARVCSTS
jgi:hypothetical protein